MLTRIVQKEYLFNGQVDALRLGEHVMKLLPCDLEPTCSYLEIASLNAGVRTHTSDCPQYPAVEGFSCTGSSCLYIIVYYNPPSNFYCQVALGFLLSNIFPQFVSHLYLSQCSQDAGAFNLRARVVG